MNVLAHILITASYAIIAFFCALLVPDLLGPDLIGRLGPSAPLVLGGLIFLLGVQLHVAYVWRQGRQDMANRMLALHQDYQMSLDKLEHLENDVGRLEKQLSQTDYSRNAEIISEMRVLQTLLNQVVQKSGKSLAERLEAEERRQNRAEQESIGAVSLPRHFAEAERNEEEILKIMHHALEDNRVDLYLQPIVALPARRVVYFEAYSRVRDDHNNVIFPNQYLKLAEDSGLVGTLDNLLLFRCIQVIRRLGPRRPGLRFFCNISSVSLNDQEFFPQFIDFMLENQELADRLVFEFAQQDVIRHTPEVERSLVALGRRGFRFSMDHVIDTNIDLADLASRYFRYIKLKPALLLDEKGDIHPQDLKEAYARFDIDLIIEKIEEEREILEILDYGMDYGQGYLFGEPRLSSELSMSL
ncbi:EAL domain-containing protein [Luteithermobacter gelatinilyticus]|uniref:EAL domain-containing protein n=1 Tax=Luteithermobacter gelatinilyticus TaxID=2582913 RepID=UPI0011075D6B|nr:EAL domain-containing protein [Luteithermobacter gelatinilyticus]